MRALKFRVKQQFRRFTPAMWVVGIAALAVLAGGQAAAMAIKMARPNEMLKLDAREIRQLEAFFCTLSGGTRKQ